jgi:hypothetical protein
VCATSMPLIGESRYDLFRRLLTPIPFAGTSILREMISLGTNWLERLTFLEQTRNNGKAQARAKMIVIAQQEADRERRQQIGEIANIPAGARASLKRLCGFYGGSESELLARLISDLERDTLAMLPSAEREEYFGVECGLPLQGSWSIPCPARAVIPSVATQN